MSFTGETRERTRPAIPLAAMLDVMFLLLIFFMTASVFRQQELQIDVQLAAAETGESGSGLANSLPITIDAEGNVYLGRRELAMPELREQLQSYYEDRPNTTIIIRGDRDARLGLGLDLMDMARQIGFSNVSFSVLGPAGSSGASGTSGGSGGSAGSSQ